MPELQQSTEQHVRTDERHDVHPDVLYDPWETAEILGYRCARGVVARSKRDRRRDRVYELTDLVKTRTGPRGGKVMYRGRHILQYLAACAGESLEHELKVAS